MLLLPPPFRSSSRLRTTLVVSAVLGLALLLRVVNLSADPSALISRDFITDEGWWAHNARNALFHGQFRLDDYNLGFYSAPLYNLLLYAVLKLFGSSFAAVRLLPAACGWLTVVLLFVLVRREIGMRAGLFAAALLGYSNMHIIYSRTGFTESAMALPLALAVLMWSMRKRHAFFAFAAGLAFASMVITKITAVYLAPGIVLMWTGFIIKDRSSLRYAIHSLLGILAAGAAFVVFYLAPNFHDWLHFNIANGSGGEWSQESGGFILGLLKMPDSFMVRQPAIIAGLTLLYFAAAAIRISQTGLKTAARNASDLELMGCTLQIGYLASLALTRYHPERRFIPALFLGSILAAVLFDKAMSAGNQSIVRAPARWGWVIWFLVLFFLPAVVIIKFKWTAGLGSPLGVRFWIFKAIPVALFLWISVVISKGLSIRSKEALVSVAAIVFTLVLASLCIIAVYRAASLWGIDRLSLQSPGEHRAAFAVAVLLILVSAVLLWKMIRVGMSRSVWLVVAFLFVEGIQISTWILQPTYTLREASASLARSLGPDETVVTAFEILLIPSGAKVVTRSIRGGFNVDAFERFNPTYTLVLTRDDWISYSLGQMPPQEWPPPAGFEPAEIASFDLCPTRGRGPRFTAELYRLTPRIKKRDKREH